MSRFLRQQVGILHALGITWVPGVRPFGGLDVAVVEKKDAIRFAVWATILFTGLFYAPALGGGYLADDHFHLFALSELPEAANGTFNLFGFVTSSEEVRVLRNWGIVPWWSSDAMRIDFWRPIPSLSLWLDWVLFGRNAAAAHLVSIAWYVGVVALVYRILSRFLGDATRTLLLAVAIFALDDVHALNVQWLASRNDLIQAVFLLSAFLGWLRYREGKGRPGNGWNLVLLFGAFLLALLSKESSVLLGPICFAHALFFPEDVRDGLVARIRPRLGIFLGIAAITLCYLAFWFKAGHGPNTLYYLNPFKDPAQWASQFFRSGFFHAVILATGVPLQVLSPAPFTDYPIPAAIVSGLTIGFWIVAWYLLRRDRAAGFFVVWMLLGQLLGTTSFPDPRILFLPSIGFAYVVARTISETWARRDQWKPARPILATLVALHFVFAPILDQVCFYVVGSFRNGYAKVENGLREAVDYDRLPETGTQVFFLNWHQRESSALINLHLTRTLPAGADVSPYLAQPGSFEQRIDRGFEALKIHYYNLSFLLGEVDARVVSDHEITLAPKEGSFFPSLFEQLYLTSLKFEVGQTFELTAFKATIEAIDDSGAVTRVRFVFPKPLDHASYRFLAWNGTKFVQVNVAEAVGGRLALHARR
jgi:hypothetical protein